MNFKEQRLELALSQAGRAWRNAMTTVKLDAGPKVVVKKGISMRAGINAFGYGTLVGGAAGFAAGFTLAQAIYSDEMERKAVKRTAKITAIACGGALVVGAIGSILARR